MIEILINRCFGGFDFSEGFISEYPEVYEKVEVRRDDPELIEAVREFGLKSSAGSMSAFGIAHVPDDATDWEIQEYDGLESVIYVQNGKIHHCHDIERER